MPQFNIHWKGCPHRHLPRIRVASPQYGSGSGCLYAHFAALEASRLPYSLAFQRARLQQRIRTHRRKQRSRGSLGGIIVSRRTPQREMSDIRLFGLESPQGDLASKERHNKETETPMFANPLSTISVTKMSSKG